MSSLFIANDPADKLQAIALKQWLGSNGWRDEDVFLDIGSEPERQLWLRALRDASERCQAVVFLASAHSLASPDCLSKIRKAEDFGKELVILLVENIDLGDARLDYYRERPIVNLCGEPRDFEQRVFHQGKEYSVEFNREALGKLKEVLFHCGAIPSFFPWPPVDRPDAEPFPGFRPFREDEAGIFFGRDADIMRGLDRLRLLRLKGAPRVFAILGAAGVGKSSYLRAGIWPRLRRDPAFTPLGILRPADGLMGLVAILSGRDSQAEAHALYERLRDSDEDAALAELEKQLAAAAKRARSIAADAAAGSPGLVLGIDPADDLLVASDSAEDERLLLLLAHILNGRFRSWSESPVEPFCLLTVRTDNASQLFEKLGVRAPDMLSLLALPSSSYLQIIISPLEVQARNGRRCAISPILVDKLIADAGSGAGLGPLMFMLSCLYREFSAAGTIDVPMYDSAGGLSGCIEVAVRQALSRPEDLPSIPLGEDEQLQLLRTVLLPALVTIDTASGKPGRRFAPLTAFQGGARAMVERLIAARVVLLDHHKGEDVLAVASDAVLHEWPRLKQWIAEELKFYSWRSDVEESRRRWQSAEPDRKLEALLTGSALAEAQAWLQARPEDISESDRHFIRLSSEKSQKQLMDRLKEPSLSSPSITRPVPHPLGATVFISYRRNDTRHFAGRVYDHLTNEIPEKDIFFDVGTVPIGVNFKDHIKGAVEKSAVMIVIIGQNWLSPQWRHGTWRWWSKTKEDYVESEVQMALDMGVPILPILVDGVPMPRRDQVPKAMADFVFLNAAIVGSGADFKRNMEAVMNTIKELRAEGIKEVQR